MIDTEIWTPDPDKPGSMRYVGQRPIREVREELEKALADTSLRAAALANIHDQSLLDLLEGGLSVCWDDTGKRLDQFPRGRHIACFAVRGSSEGHYIHVEVLGGHPERVTVFLAKTFHGLAAALAVAGALTAMFHE